MGRQTCPLNLNCFCSAWVNPIRRLYPNQKFPKQEVKLQWFSPPTTKLVSKYSLHSGLTLDMVTPIMPEQIFVKKNLKADLHLQCQKKQGGETPKIKTKEVGLQHYIHCSICLLIFCYGHKHR